MMWKIEDLTENHGIKKKRIAIRIRRGYIYYNASSQGSWSDFGKLGKVSTNSTGFTTRGNKEKSDERLNDRIH